MGWVISVGLQVLEQVAPVATETENRREGSDRTGGTGSRNQDHTKAVLSSETFRCKSFCSSFKVALWSSSIFQLPVFSISSPPAALTASKGDNLLRCHFSILVSP